MTFIVVNIFVNLVCLLVGVTTVVRASVFLFAGRFSVGSRVEVPDDGAGGGDPPERGIVLRSFLREHTP